MGPESFHAAPPVPELPPEEPTPDPLPQEPRAEQPPEPSSVETQPLDTVEAPAGQEQSASETELGAREAIAPDVDSAPDRNDNEERARETGGGNESQERMRFVRQSLESVSDSIDRVGWALKDREDRGLNEFYPQDTKERLGSASRSLRELSGMQEPPAEDIGGALNRAAHALEEFGTRQPRGPLREDTESLRRLGSSMRIAQESLTALSSRLAHHPDESFKSLAGRSAYAHRTMEEAIAAVARRHGTVDRYMRR